MPQEATKYFAKATLSKMKRVFGDDLKSMRVDKSYAREVKVFVRRLEKAHRQTAESKLVFK